MNASMPRAFQARLPMMLTLCSGITDPPSFHQAAGLRQRLLQVVEPKVTAWLYSWGEGRVTAEGEHIPCRIEELEIGYIDGMMCAPTPASCFQCIPTSCMGLGTWV